MVTRAKKPRRPAKKAPAKKATSNSKISQAQKAASEKRIEQDTLRGQAGADRASREQKNFQKDPNNPALQARTNTPMASSGRGVDQDKVAARDNVLGTSMQAAAAKIAGLATGLQKQNKQDEAKAANAASPKAAIANPGLYGVSNAKRATNLSDRIAAMNMTLAQLKQKGNAVFMGYNQPSTGPAKIRTSGPERIDPETGKSYTEEKDAGGHLTATKDELLSWLTDDAKVQQIKDAATKAGITLDNYSDIAKLWTSVVSTAASAYSLSGKPVTPWALIALQGKYMVNGRPADRVTTSTSVDEMDPAQARLMFEQTAQQALGRAPTKAEVDDFIAKAQTIAKQNPGVTTTTHHMGLDGNEVAQDSITKGGADVVSAKAQVAAMDQARQSEDYQSYQAAGNYFPMLFDALKAPV